MKKRLFFMLLISAALACCIRVSPAGRYEIYGEDPVLSGGAFRGEFTFLAPPETTKMIVRVEEYREGAWRAVHEEYMDAVRGQTNLGGFGGTAAVTSQPDSSVLLELDFCGSKRSSTALSSHGGPGLNSSRLSLHGDRPILPDKVFPIAIFTFDKTNLFRTFALDIYDQPERLQEYQLVQAVTLEFATADGAGE